MINFRSCGGFLLVVLPLALNAQVAREYDPVALRYWAAPLYWHAQGADERYAALATTNLPSNANPLVFVAMTPCRVADTRAAQGFPGAFGAPSLVGGTSRTFPMQSSTTCTIPAAAQAYSLNITVVPPGPLGFITAYPTGQPLPLAATVNSPEGFIVGNAAIVPAGTNGSIDIFASNPTDVVIDTNGYYAPITGASGNTALGIAALGNNATGGGNTATGASALQNNTTGGSNTATGDSALQKNTTGVSNTATGTVALQNNTTGGGNTAIGYGALSSNTTGGSNIAIGEDALESNVSGNGNIAIGNFAASNVGSGNFGNIQIGNTGSSGDNGVIRIGDPNFQSSFFAAGVRGVTTGNNNAVPVMIDSNGQLGTVNSSERFKEHIQDMGEASGGLMRLRPVTFRYRRPFADGSKPIQYGLIAEEVGEVYPDLVTHSADGQIETVKYQVLDSMLLNEVQRQQKEIGSQQEQVRRLEAQIEAERQQNLLLVERLAKLEAAVAATVP